MRTWLSTLEWFTSLWCSYVPMYYSLCVSLSLSLVVEKKIYVHFSDKSETSSTTIEHQLLFDKRKSTRQIISTFVPDVFSPFFVTTLVNNDSIFISKKRKRGKNLIYSFNYRSISGYESLFVSSMYPYWSDIIPLSKINLKSNDQKLKNPPYREEK